MRVSVFGLGYVGCVTAACLAKAGHTVVGVDVNAEKVAMINAATSPIVEPGLPEMVRRNVAAGRLRFTGDVGEAVQHATVVFIAVGTPPAGDGAADLQYIEDAARVIAKHLDRYTVVVTKSTVPVGTGACGRPSSLVRERLLDISDYKRNLGKNYRRKQCRSVKPNRW